MNLPKRIPELSFDYMMPTPQETDLSTYKPRSIVKITNIFPAEVVPDVSDFIFGDSDEEPNMSLIRSKSIIKGTSNPGTHRLRPITLKRSNKLTKKALPIDINQLADIDPNQLFENFEKVFQVRVLSDEECAKINSNIKEKGIPRDLKKEFENEESKERVSLIPISLKPRGKSSENIVLKRQDSLYNLRPPTHRDHSPQSHEKKFYFPQKIINKAKEYHMKKSSEINPLSVGVDEKSKIDLESFHHREKSYDRFTNSRFSKNIPQDDYFQNKGNYFQGAQQSFGEQFQKAEDVIPQKSLIIKKRIEKKSTSQNQRKSTQRNEANTKQIFQDITNYGYKDRNEAKRVDAEKDEQDNIKRPRLSVAIKGKDENNENVRERKVRPVQRKSSTKREGDENCPDKFIKKIQSIVNGYSRGRVEEIHPFEQNLLPRGSFFRDKTPGLSRTDNQLSFIKRKEVKISNTKLQRQPSKPKLENIYKENQERRTLAYLPNQEFVTNQSHIVTDYFNVIADVYKKNDKRAISVPKRVY